MCQRDVLIARRFFVGLAPVVRTGVAQMASQLIRSVEVSRTTNFPIGPVRLKLNCPPLKRELKTMSAGYHFLMVLLSESAT